MKKSFAEMVSLLEQAFGQGIFPSKKEDGLMPWLEVEKGFLSRVCLFLFENKTLYFDQLSCITAIDLGPENGQIEVVYNFSSIPFEHCFCLKVKTSRDPEMAQVQSVGHIWHTAYWHEREAYDLFGVSFEGHPDLRRILLPADWQGHPMRKDYQDQDLYHQIKIAY